MDTPTSIVTAINELVRGPRFCMWMTALVGMATKYAEGCWRCTAVRPDDHGAGAVPGIDLGATRVR